MLITDVPTPHIHARPAIVARAAPVDRYEPGDWPAGGVAYGVVPPFFSREKPLVALTEKLPELQELGVDALWLSPVQATDDPSAISYATTDYCALRPDYGTPEEMKTLVREAKARGMKVLLDIAPNHVSDQHPWYRDAEERGPASPYYDYFDRDAEGNATYYFDWSYLINLNYANPQVREKVAEAFEYWIREYDVDGFRVDVAWGPKTRDFDFWPWLNERLNRLKPDVFMLAEGTARDGYFAKAGFDAAYDWNDRLGHWAWEDVFEDPEQIGPRLDAALRRGLGTPPARFLNNNDTGDRFITRYGPERARAAATLLLTLPGLPIVYMGDEVGAEFRPYDDPPPISWEDPHGLRPHYRKLIELREQLPSLASGDLTPVGVDKGSAYAFMRSKPGEKPVLVVLNFGDEQTVTVDLPPGRWEDQLGGPPVTRKELRMGPGESRVLTPGS